jgi:dimethylargininase
MRLTRALVRQPSPELSRCELTHLPRQVIDADLAREQHAAYVSALAQLGAAVEWLPPLPHQPDGVFVEDTAVVLPELAVVTRPGAASRRAEVPSVERALAAYRPLRWIREPGTLDGGDVLCIGRSILAGLSSRTNEQGITQLRQAVREFGYDVRAVQVAGCLHLKSACTMISAGTVIANLACIDAALFGGVKIIEVDASEAGAANTLTLGSVTLVSSAYPQTEDRLRRVGIQTRAIDVSELQKAESGLTCMSLIVR